MTKNMKYGMTINGESVFSAAFGEVINPATEEVVSGYPLASREQLDAAVTAAQNAFPAWAATPLAKRQQLVSQLGDMLEQHSEEFKRLLTTEQGKARSGADWEIDGSVYWLREVAKQSLEDEVMTREGEFEVVTRHTPIGVVGAITPWNFPLLLAVWKIAPALVAGNTIVVKPSPYTPLCTLWFGELAQKILPPGVLNVVSGGNELGQWLTEHPAVGKIAFTGSTETGRKVMASAASGLKRLTLELGGNDPAIVMPDVDAKGIAKDLFWTAFSNSAQFCVAAKRLYVHEDVYDDVARELVAYASTVKVASGAEPDTQLGPLQNKMQYDKVRSLLRDSAQNGHRFLLGGVEYATPGYFIPVTLIDNPPEDSRCVVEEAFGPVLPLLKFRDIDDVIRRANDTQYGLAATIWSRDVAKAEQIAARIQAGTVWINQAHTFSPAYAFGGHKQSGMGIENSLHGLAEYTNVQTVMRKPLA